MNELLEYIETWIMITCDNPKCNLTTEEPFEGWRNQEEEFAKEMTKQGWQVINDKPYCATCAEKIGKV